MKTILASFAVALLATMSFNANADAYAASIQGCEKAIGERLGIADATYNVQKVNSAARYRDLSFSVSAADASHPVQNLKVTCRAKQDGEVLAVNYDESALPTAVATH